MIEETASVVSVEGDQVWVETHRKTVCGSCSVKKGCGTSSLDQLFGHRRTQMRVSSELPVSAGDEVILGINESVLFRGSLAMYGLPIVSMLAAAIIVQYLIPLESELPVIAAALAGFGVGLLMVAGFSRKLRSNSLYHPTILKVIRPYSQQSNGIFAP